MDLLQEDNVQEDINPNSGSLAENTIEEKTSSFENNNPGEDDVNLETVPSTITSENNSPQKSEDDPENNNLVEFVVDSEEGHAARISEESIGMTVTEENTISSGVKQPFGFSCDNSKACSDDDSIDSSIDSSSSSSSSSSSEEEDEDDEMEDDKEEERNNDEDELPKVSPGEKQEPHENGNSKIPNFPTYRNINDVDSDDSSSDSSSTSEINKDNNADTKRKPPPRHESDSEDRSSRPRVKGEIFPEELPALENLNVSVDDKVNLRLFGKITSIINNIAVARAEFSSPIDQDSMIFLKDRNCIGKIHDIFGPVREPFYTVLLDKKYTMIPIDTEIYCAPEEREYTNYVFVNDLKSLKGSDASWDNDLEPPEKFLDFSDDEQERRKKKHNKCKNSANEDSSDDANDKNGKSQRKNKLRSSTRNWKKKAVDLITFLSATDASQKSMFACSTTWPPSNEQGSFTSWPPPPPPPPSLPPPPPPALPPPPPPPPPPYPYPYPQPNNPVFQEGCNQLNQQMMWPPNYSQPNSPADTMAPFRPPWNFHQRPSTMGPYPGAFNYPQSGHPFVPPPPNQPWFRGPQRPPPGPQGTPRPHGPYNFMRNPPHRFSHPPQFPGKYP